jgi:hypothetical protein
MRYQIKAILYWGYVTNPSNDACVALVLIDKDFKLSIEFKLLFCVGQIGNIFTVRTIVSLDWS